MTEFFGKTPSSRKVAYKHSGGMSLKELDLSRRTYNALIRGGLQSIDELIQLPRERLERIRNIGPTSLEEIDSQLALYHARTKSAVPGVQGEPQSPANNKPHLSVHSRYNTSATDTLHQYSSDEWRETFRPLATNKTPISTLILPEGLKQRLEEAGLKTMADLAQATIRQLLSLPQTGGKSVSRLRTALIAYMLEADTPFDVSPEDEAIVEAVTPRQHALETLTSPDVAVQLAEAPLDLIPVERLTLNPTQTNELYQATVYTVGQLVDFSGYLAPGDPVLTALRAYLATAKPDQLVQDTLSAEVLQRHWSRKAADVTFWLLSLKERERSILEKRYGLYGPVLTLEEIGQQINLSRERVRQLEKGALRRLKWKHSANVNAMADALTDYIQECGGVLALAEAADWHREQYPPVSGVDPTGAIGLLAALTNRLRYLRGPKVFLDSNLPTELLANTQKTLTDLLQARMSPTAVDVLLDDFQVTPVYQSARSLWSDALGFDLDVFAKACLRTNNDLVEQEPGIYGRRQWENRITDNIVVALREIGEPAHFTTITDAVNRQLSPDRQSSAHNVHSTMLRYEDVFTRVGHGTYALVEWGLRREGTVAETAARILRDAGQPLHIETITDEALKSWQVNRSTVYAALQYDGYYREDSDHSDLCLLLGDGVFTLSEWEAARATEPRPVLAYCPPVLPDPPDFKNALFESVIVANKHLATAPEASKFLDGMFAWARYDGQPRRWLQQGVLNSYYLLGLIPYTYIFGGDDPRLSSTLMDGSISQIRERCLVSLTQTLLHMPMFWWLLSHRLPMRQKELAAELVEARGDGLDDTEARLTMLAGLGVVIRGEDYYFRLTPLGKAIANDLGFQPLSGFVAEPAAVATSGRGGWDDLLDFGVLE